MIDFPGEGDTNLKGSTSWGRVGKNCNRASKYWASFCCYKLFHFVHHGMTVDTQLVVPLDKIIHIYVNEIILHSSYVRMITKHKASQPIWILRVFYLSILQRNKKYFISPEGSVAA